MMSHQRVALRYAARLDLENPSREEKIKYTIKGNAKESFQIVTYHGRRRIGQVQGGKECGRLEPYRVGLEAPVDKLACSKDVRSLAEQYPQIVHNDWSSPEARIISVYKSAIKEEYRAKKIGVDMYLAFARAHWDAVGKPFILIPDGCTQMGWTSENAKRVWLSLKRKYPSSGYCIAILNRP